MTSKSKAPENDYGVDDIDDIDADELDLGDVVEGEVISPAVVAATVTARSNNETALTTYDGEIIELPAQSPLRNMDESTIRMMLQILDVQQVSMLMARTPPHEVKERSIPGGGRAKYVDIGYVLERLNAVFGYDWDVSVLSKEITPEEIILEVQLVVRTRAGRTVVKTQYGNADIKRRKDSKTPLSIGNDYKAALSDGIKKCASLLGIGLDVMSGDSEQPYEEQPVVVDPVDVDERDLDTLRKVIGGAGKAMGIDRDGITDLVARMTNLNQDPDKPRLLADVPRRRQVAIAQWFERGADLMTGRFDDSDPHRKQEKQERGGRPIPFNRSTNNKYRS